MTVTTSSFDASDLDPAEIDRLVKMALESQGEESELRRVITMAAIFGADTARGLAADLEGLNDAAQLERGSNVAQDSRPGSRDLAALGRRLGVKIKPARVLP